MAELICTCVRCGHERTLSDIVLAAIDDQAFQDAVAAAAQLPPPLADSVIRYMRLFGAVRPATYAKLLADLVTAINAGKFTHKRQEWSASPALWLAAFTDTLGSTTIRLPLKAANGHGFLYAIAAAKADAAAARAEQQREEALRGVSRPTGAAQPATDPTVPQAPGPSPADLRLRSLRQDVDHWRRLHTMRPNDGDIQKSLDGAIARLHAEFPHLAPAPQPTVG